MKTIVALTVAVVLTSCTDAVRSDKGNEPQRAESRATPSKGPGDTHRWEPDKVFDTTAMVCTRSPCRIEVIVEGEHCRVSPEILFVRRSGGYERQGAKPGVRIEWHLGRESRARFAEHPFSWKKYSEHEAAGEFDLDDAARDGSYGIVDHVTKRGAFHYQLTVMHGRGSCLIDPPVVNEY